MVIRLPGGSNSGGSSGGGAPTGAAGGSLTGTYPNPTIATIPSGATATTQTAADASTKVATTAYTDTGLALKANLAGPTFTGVVTLPTGAVATTQTADNNSTALATTAYADAIKALKANLASPTFTGTPSLPTGTTGTTQSATDGSTKLATTAYVDTADALKANLASPTFTGTPTLPTGTILTTQGIGDSSTKAASTAFVAANINVGLATQIGPSTYATVDSRLAGPTGQAHASANDSRFMRVTMAKTGNLRDVSVFVVLQGGNMKIGVYDTGNANGTHTTSTQLAISGAIDISGATSTWKTYDPNLAVTAGDVLNLHIAADGTTAQFLGVAGNIAGQMTLPASFYPPSGAGTMTAKTCGLTSTFYASPPATITDANHTAAAKALCIIWRIT